MAGRIKTLKDAIKRHGRFAKEKASEVKKMEKERKSLKKLKSTLAAGAGIVATIFSPRQAEISSRLKKGEVVSMGEVYGAGALDVIGIFDPGLMDLLGF